MSAREQDPDLEFLIHQAESILGARGTLAGVLSVLECGGSTGGNLGEDGLYVHPFTDQQLGTGKVLRGEIERCRWLYRAWVSCSPGSRNLLTLRHLAPRAAFRSDEGFGARDRHVEGSDGKAGHHGARRTGVEAQLGELASVALVVYPEPGELLVACHSYSGDAGKPSPTVTGKQAAYGRTIRRARRVAEKALAPAWAEWFVMKDFAEPMRLTRDRRAILSAHVGAEAAE